MIKNFEYRGIWNLPTSTEIQVEGTLIFDPNGQIILELMGTLNSDPFDDGGDEEIIQGFTTTGKKITLLNCSKGGKVITFPGIPVTKYFPNLIFEGEHFSATNELKFYKLTGNITKLEEWVGIYGLDVEFTPKSKELSVSYTIPDELSFKINDQLKGSFSFSYQAPLFVSSDYTIKQTTSLSLTLEEEVSYDILLKHLSRFKSFITMGTFEDISTRAIKLYSSKILNQKQKEEAINVYYSQKNINPRADSRSSVRFLFTYEQIAPHFETIIQRWFTLEEKLAPVISILMESFSRRKFFSENIFLNVVQALEIFHRRVKQDTEELRIKFKEELEPVLASLNETQKAWVVEKLEFRYEPNLRTRLKLLFKEYGFGPISQIIKNKNDKNNIVNKATISRNYYTHYNEDLKDKACRGGELFLLTEKLKVLLILVVLRESGFSNEEIETMFENKTYMYFNHLYTSG